MAQTILNELLNSCLGSVERCLIYDYEPFGREADLFTGFRSSLQELGVNDDSGSLGKPKLVSELFQCVCRVRISSYGIREKSKSK